MFTEVIVNVLSFGVMQIRTRRDIESRAITQMAILQVFTLGNRLRKKLIGVPIHAAQAANQRSH